MACCTTEKHPLQLPPRVHNYPCKTTQAKPCSYVRLEALVDLAEFRGKDQVKAQDEPAEKIFCDRQKPPSKKKFLAMGQKEICAIPYSRRWNSENNPCSFENMLPKSFKRKRITCPRVLDDYEKNLWAPICKPRVKTKICKTPIDEGVCVFCLGSLYTGGYLYELFQNVPAVKKQSEIYGDEIAWRIGIRTRVIVHKKCYDSYTDVASHKEEEEFEVDLGNGDLEDDENSNCGQKEEEEGEGKEGKKSDKGKNYKKKSKDSKLSENLRKQYFCLKKFKLPKIESGKFLED